MTGLYDSPDASLRVRAGGPAPAATPPPSPPTDPLVALTTQQRRAGIAEAVMRASFDAVHDDDPTDTDVVVTGQWQSGAGGAIGVVVEHKRVSGAVVFAKHYDDLAVLGQIRLTRK